MTLHTFIQSILYKWKAKGRHGTYSPFVYDFVEHVLQNKGPIGQQDIIKLPTLPLAYENLISRIAAYYHYNIVLKLPSANITSEYADLLLISDVPPAQWQDLVEQHQHLLTNNSAIIITSIHKTKDHTTTFKKICALGRVRMSMDMYGVGMLLFKQEFKERQHFVLKYR